MADVVKYLQDEFEIRIEELRKVGKGSKQQCIWHCQEHGRFRRCERGERPKINHAILTENINKINRRVERLEGQGGRPSRDDFDRVIEPMAYIVEVFSCCYHKNNGSDYRAKHLAMDFFMFGKLGMQQESQVKKRKMAEVEGDTIASSSSTSMASTSPRPIKRGRQTSKSSNESSDMATQTMSSSPSSTSSAYGGLKETNTQTTNTTENNLYSYQDTASNVNLNLQFQDNAVNHYQETVYPGAQGIPSLGGFWDGDRNTGHAAGGEEGVMATSIAAEPDEPLFFTMCEECARSFSHDVDVEWSGTCFWCGKVKEMIPVAGQ